MSENKPLSDKRRAERVAAQSADDGDAQDTVYIVGNINGKSYHEDRECNALKAADRSVRALTREQAQRRWRSPCQRCGGDDGD